MAKHECDLPNTSARTWKCPVCRKVWDFKPGAGTLTVMWHGARNVRNANGSKLKKKWWH